MRNGNYQFTHVRLGQPCLTIVMQEMHARGIKSRGEMLRVIIGQWCEDRGVPVPLVKDEPIMRLAVEKERT